MALEFNQTSNADKVRIGLIHLPPAMDLRGQDDNIRLGGYFGEFFSLIFSLLNASYQYVRISDNKFGSLDKTSKNWSGMMKYLVENKIEIGASLTQTRSRQDFVKFSPILYTSSYRLLYRTSDTVEWSFRFFLKPFQANLWASVLAISTMVILYALYRSYYLNCIIDFIRNFFLHITLIWPIVHITPNISANIASSRIIFICYYIFGLLMIISYSSLLTAMLTVAKHTVPFNSLDDMIMETNYFPVIVEGRSIQEDFLTATTEPWTTGWQKILENKPKSMVSSNEEGIDVTYSTKAAFITTLEDVQTISQNCSFNFAPGSFGLLTDSIAYKANFTLAEEFNRKIIHFGECGILLQLARRYYIGEKLCTNIDTNNEPVNMQIIVGIILVYTCGLLISLIACSIEILVSKVNEKRRIFNAK